MIAVSYDLAGAVEHTGIHERVIRDAIKVGDLVAHVLTDRPGAKYYIRHQDLDEWVASLPVWKPAS